MNKQKVNAVDLQLKWNVAHTMPDTGSLLPLTSVQASFISSGPSLLLLRLNIVLFHKFIDHLTFGIADIPLSIQDKISIVYA